MVSDSKPRKFFRGPPLGGPKFLQILYNAMTDFHNGRVNKSYACES